MRVFAKAFVHSTKTKVRRHISMITASFAILGALACTTKDARRPDSVGLASTPRYESVHPRALDSAGRDTSWYLDFEVDTAVDIRPGNAPPKYPEELRANDIEGRVVARFIVDTMGRPEPSTFRAVSSSHRYFTEAVQKALPKMRFLPAKYHGHRVRQLVQMPFEFRLNR